VETWQALNSEHSVRYAARYGHVGVLNLGRLESTLAKWRYYGDLLQDEQHRQFRPGERRALKITAHVASTRAAALAAMRPGHAERYRYLALQRPLVEYQDERGVAFAPGRVPTLEESIAHGGWLVGSDAEVRDRLLELTERFCLEYLVVQLQVHGLEQSAVLAQIDRLARLVI
jgi:alkanesulfonate monooxygenase SsuD/methylene tetrahydromethanopterin reductase-like flavin-dependent oxidoreductase (luciferase family)